MHVPKRVKNKAYCTVLDLCGRGYSPIHAYMFFFVTCIDWLFVFAIHVQYYDI